MVGKYLDVDLRILKHIIEFQKIVFTKDYVAEIKQI